jgi:hypothetical protein
MIGDLTQRNLMGKCREARAWPVLSLCCALLVGSSAFGAASAVLDDPPAASPARPAQPQAKPDAPAADSGEPDAEEIYDKFIEAIGGKKAVDDVETVHAKSTLLAGSQPLIIETNWHRDGAFTVEYALSAVINRAGSDGAVGWFYNSASGYRLIPPDAVASVRDRSSYPTMLFSMSQRYDKMRLIGRDTFNKQPAYRVELTDGDGSTRFAYFDRETDLLLGMRWTEQAPIGEINVEMLFEKWKEYGDIRMWSRLVITKMNTIQTLEIDEMEFNEVTPETFMLPEEVKDLVANQPQAEPAAPPTPRAKQ